MWKKGIQQNIDQMANSEITKYRVSHIEMSESKWF